MMQRNVPYATNKVKGQSRHPLSSGAYFDDKHECTHTPNPNIQEYTPQSAMRLIHPAQTRRIRHAKPAKITVYADMLKLSYPDYANGVIERDSAHAGGGIRGNISGFSRASRKRMIEFMAKVRNVQDMYFVTMTYDDESWLMKHDDHHADFEAFRRRFERAFPNFRAIWRVEVKERLSGLLKGNNVPHFHLLIFTNRSDSNEDKEAYSEGFRAWGVRVWGEILQAQNPAFEKYGYHVTPVRSRKMAYAYVSKYIGKQDNDEISCGRRWGRIGQFDTSSSEGFLLSDNETIELRRLIRKWLKRRNGKFASRFAKYCPGTGFTVFGLGDTDSLGNAFGIFDGYNQFLGEVKRLSADQKERERSYGD